MTMTLSAILTSTELQNFVMLITRKRS